MNTSKLKKDLKELKEGIDNPNIPDNIKEGMKETIADLEAKIAGEGKSYSEPAEKHEGKHGRKTSAWTEFMKGKMGSYMEKYGSHGAAIKQLAKEF